MSSASGGFPQTPTRALPLDPTGGLLPPFTLFCPPPKQIYGYASDQCMFIRDLQSLEIQFEFESAVHVSCEMFSHFDV